MIRHATPMRLLALATLTLWTLSTFALDGASNKWRLQFSGGARSDGAIVLEIAPVGGTPMQVEIAVPGGTSENKVAKIVTQRLKESLPDDAYHVERDDGEDVLVKKRLGAASFKVSVISNSVKHVRINLDRE